MKRIVSILAPVVMVIGTVGSAEGENWAQWRGPFFNGSTSEKGLPSHFSKSEKVKWVAPLPGPSAATPVIWDTRVFVSAVEPQAKVLLAICLDRTSGKELWRHEAGVGIALDNRSNFASPSPVTDGNLAWFFYGNGELVCYNARGDKVWSRNIQKDYGQFAFQWTFGATPLLYDGRLYVQVLQRNVVVNGRGRSDGPNDSYLLALDPRTGKELWREIRPAAAVAESLEAYSTPIPFTQDGRTEILIVGGDCITGHNPSDGKELWRWGTWNPNKIGHWRLVPSPVGGGGVVLACGPKGSPVYAVKAGKKGTLSDSDLAWVSSDRDVSSDVSTPLYYDGRLYVLNSDKRLLHCIEPASGKVIWTGDLESNSKVEASPTAADGKIYVMNHRGDVFVVQAGSEFKLIQKTEFGEEGDRDLRSSIALAHGSLFIRTGAKLYCVAN